VRRVNPKLFRQRMVTGFRSHAHVHSNTWRINTPLQV